ncbi:MAG: threonine--tRNA ligase, partial [Bacilli bacterium]|nr:threonine--tRNA ligase [Bacilli bacterium]
MKNIKEDERLNIVNHSCAHLLAHAIKRLYPNAKFWVGPVIEEGFYYDIDLGDKVIKEEDLIIIEKEMKKISKDAKRIIRRELTRKEALDIFKNDEYKIDLINNLDDIDIITAYAQDDFIDLCRGPHLDNVKEIKYYKLLKVSGAYFKGDSKNKVLQRIYGICYETEENLNNHLNFLEEAKKRDHKILGKELDIFMISDYSPGCPIFLKNGMIIRNELERFWYDEHTNENYIFIKTPIMLNKELWELSGHWNNYRDNMYISEVDN